MRILVFPDITIIILYIILVTGYGLWKAKKVKDSEDYLVAGRSLGLFVLVGTLVMTEFNTAAMIGYSSYAYLGGTFASLMALMFLFGLGPYTLVVAKRWKRLNTVSISEMFEQRYDKRFRIFASLMIISTLALFCTAYLKAASLVFSMALNLDLVWTVILISVIVLIFTLAGGLVSVSWTNLFSFVITIFAVPILFFISKYKADSLGGLATAFNREFLSFNIFGMWNNPVLSFEFIFTLYALLFLIYMQSPWYAQIMFATKNEKTAYRGMFIATIIVVLIYWFSIETAAFVKVGFPNLDDPQMAIPVAITYWMPIGIKGLTLALIFAVCQTTMATIWNNNASIITQDIYRGLINPSASDKKVLFISRILTLFIALFTIIVSITVIDVVIQVMFFANIFMVSLFFPAIGGFLWWKAGKKASWIATILGIISGWAIFFSKKYFNDGLPQWFQNHDWLFIYCCVAAPIVIIIGILISLNEKTDENFIKKKILFFEKVGAPWFGKKEFLKYKDDLKIEN